MLSTGVFFPKLLGAFPLLSTLPRPPVWLVSSLVDCTYRLSKLKGPRDRVHWFSQTGHVAILRTFPGWLMLVRNLMLELKLTSTGSMLQVRLCQR